METLVVDVYCLEDCVNRFMKYYNTILQKDVT